MREWLFGSEITNLPLKSTGLWSQWKRNHKSQASGNIIQLIYGLEVEQKLVSRGNIHQVLCYIFRLSLKQSYVVFGARATTAQLYPG